jgi:NitT/TauT family transport system ATP-binding protein
MSAVKIRFEQVRKEFAIRRENGGPARRFTALDDITLDVKSGEFLALVGPSGCGKSTLLDLLGGLETPTSGRILLDGRPILGPARDRGIVFQQYALFPWRTAVQNVEFGLDIAGLKSKARREKALH